MTKEDFLEFYNRTVQILANSFISEHSEFQYNDVSNSIYEEYACQKMILRMVYKKRR